MKISEFADAVEKFVEQAKNAGIPLNEIIDELEGIKTAVEDELADSDDPEEEEEEGEEEEPK